MVGLLVYVRLAGLLEERYPPAPPAALADDPTCAICRDQVRRAGWHCGILGACGLTDAPLAPQMVDKACLLPCNHVFHRPCLLSWLQRQSTCPICRIKLPGLAGAVESFRIVSSFRAV